jgi:transcriptional regulator with XRE-family HTH domain
MSKRDTSELDKLIGSHIQTRRSMLGITQGELGDHLGITFQQVQKYENGANRVSASRLWLIAEHLGCALSDFFEGLEGGDTVAQYVDTPEAVSVAQAMASIESNKVRRDVLRLVRTIASEPVAA